jgi:ferredoxin-thioredoxin reductase catalytic subunit
MTDREEARALMARLKAEAEQGGYLLNPDEDMVLSLMRGLLTNQRRHGYQACPCREVDGDLEIDRDIVCPCDYRDPDLDEFGTCFCALYVSEAVARGERKVGPVPERRPEPEELARRRAEARAGEARGVFAAAGLPVWRCQVCGYLCARPTPPLKCPICKVSKERFERFA